VRARWRTGLPIFEAFSIRTGEDLGGVKLDLGDKRIDGVEFQIIGLRIVRVEKKAQPVLPVILSITVKDLAVLEMNDGLFSVKGLSGLRKPFVFLVFFLSHKILYKKDSLEVSDGNLHGWIPRRSIHQGKVKTVPVGGKIFGNSLKDPAALEANNHFLIRNHERPLIFPPGKTGTSFLFWNH
jgi:hypothetical protein